VDKDYLELVSSRAFRALLRGFPPISANAMTTGQALGRFLAEPVTSPEDLPAMSRSVMDGYAVRAEDSFGATETNPTYLDLAQELGVNSVSTKPLAPGQCASLFTGSSLPPGANAVVMVEYAQDLGSGTIEIRKSVAPGDNIVLVGEDVLAGRAALPAGARLRPTELGFLAALGVRAVIVHSAPTVAVFSTGDELVGEGETLVSGMIRDANAPAIAAMISQAGAKPVCLGIVADSVPAIASRIEEGLEKADAVFLSGGSSVGARDLTVEALSRLPGCEILVHGLAVNPGKPTILARVGDKAVWGLPGQVASAQVIMHVFGLPFLDHISGDRAAFTRPRPRLTAELSRNVASKLGRENFIRVRLLPREGRLPLATPVLGKSGLLGSLLKADGLVSIPADQEGLEGGTIQEVLLL
jgi:molybdopterin molybdotransferase